MTTLETEDRTVPLTFAEFAWLLLFVASIVIAGFTLDLVDQNHDILRVLTDAPSLSELEVTRKALAAEVEARKLAEGKAQDAERQRDEAVGTQGAVEGARDSALASARAARNEYLGAELRWCDAEWRAAAAEARIKNLQQAHDDLVQGLELAESALDEARNELGESRDAYGRFSSEQALLRSELIGLTGDLSHTIILLDRSASMGRDGRWDRSLGIIRLWIDLLPIGKLQVIVFNHELNFIPEKDAYLDLTGVAAEESRNTLKQGLANLRPDGQTSTYAALKAAYDMPDLSCIIMISDGRPTSPRELKFDAAQVAQIHSLVAANENRNVRIHTLGLGNYFDTGLGTFLRDLSEKTGGSFIGR